MARQGEMAARRAVCRSRLQFYTLSYRCFLASFVSTRRWAAIMAGQKPAPRRFSMLKVILPDGSFKEFPGSVPVKDVAAAIGPRLFKAAIAAEVDGKVVGLDYKLPADG